MQMALWLIVGVLIGSLSPLLTFARLFQMKEWRLDRLLEHLRREGWVLSLFGSTRFVIGIAYIFITTTAPLWIAGMGIGGPEIFIVPANLLFGTYALLAFLTLFQIIARKQYYPIWTKKAQLLVMTALLITSGITVVALLPMAGWSHIIFLLILPLIQIAQCLILLVAWLLWKPVDSFLKHRLLSRAASHRASLTDATVIGIVGSVGKTTTKELLKCVLADLTPITTPEHVNTELGVANWLVKTVPAHAKKPLLIVEMGAYRKGEIATLCRVAQPTIGVVTALGSDHLALFGSEEVIVDANAEILDALPVNGHVFLLGDNESAKGLKKRATCLVTIAGSADATEIRDTDRGLTLESQGSRFTVALHGMHNVGNALLAIAVARKMGIKDERIRELLAGFRGSAHTFHLRKERGVLILDDTYNVSPLSFRAALDWAASRPERPRVLLTSGLLETGSDEARFLQELGATATTCVERVVFTTSAGADAFTKGFGNKVDLLSSASPVTDDALLICVGRMPLSTIQKLLPNDR